MERIRIEIDTNERGTSRAEAVVSAASADPRFYLLGFAELPSDLRFSGPDCVLHVELKEPSDFVFSVTNGHLYKQILSLRESNEPAFVAVLGSKKSIAAAISKMTRRKMHVSAQRYISTMSNVLRDFRANSYALGVPVLYDMSAEDILSHAHKILRGGDLLRHRPKIAENERDVVALCCLVPGIGPKKAAALLDGRTLPQFLRWCNENKNNLDEKLCAISGIGPKIAKKVIEVVVW